MIDFLMVDFSSTRVKSPMELSTVNYGFFSDLCSARQGNDERDDLPRGMLVGY